ncbi:MAG: hypothetical protein D6712_09230 [Chloroflexi bacterium]|nr:MAG: hypothetical protein D6712_09230 [Chloroflexota bacterium]
MIKENGEWEGVTLSDNELERKLQQGIAAAKAGDRTTARRLLEEVVDSDPDNELAWIWLASAVTNLKERRACLQRVLQINPQNRRAQEALAKLNARLAQMQSGDDSGEADALEQLRQMQRGTARPASRPETDAPTSSVNLTGLLGVALIAFAVIGIGLALNALFNRPEPLPPTPSITERTPVFPTQPPATVPAVAVDIERVTRSAPTLPPTFTPTHTPTATSTPTPTITPYPLTLFTVYYTSRQPDAPYADLYRMNGDGSDETFVMERVEEAVYSRDGEQLALVLPVEHPDGSTFTEIFIAPADSPQEAVQVTEFNTADVHSPSWAPGGRLLVFVSDWDGDDELWMIDVENPIPVQLTFNDGIDRDPDWSPDGSRIVYASDIYSPGLTEIFTLELYDDDNRPPLPEGIAPESDEAKQMLVGKITQLTDVGGASYQPSWSFDGEHIVYISDYSGDSDVYIMEASGQASFRLTVDDGNAEDRNPVFTPDGRFIAFSSNRINDTFNFFLINRRGSELIQLTSNDRDDQHIIYKPERQLLIPNNR